MKYRKNLVALSVVMLLLVSFSVAALVSRHNEHNGAQVKTGKTGTHGTKSAHQSAGLMSLNASLESAGSVSLNISDHMAKHGAATHSGRGKQGFPGADSFKQAHSGSLDDGISSGFKYGDGTNTDTVQSGFWKTEGKPGKSWLDIVDSSSAGRQIAAAAGSGMVPHGVRTTTPGNSNGPVSGTTQSPVSLTPVPEPETYAMLMAGLGLMGFVVRRRKREY